MCASDYKQKRVDYLNNWPNNTPFEIETVYREHVKICTETYGSIFQPFALCREEDVAYNQTLSFLIDALDSLETKPNHSYEFVFKAFDCFTKVVCNESKITPRLQTLSSQKLAFLIESSPELSRSFSSMLDKIPTTACQLLYKNLFKQVRRAGDLTISQKRTWPQVFRQVVHDDHPDSNRLALLSALYAQFGYADYANSIRPGSLALRRILRQDSVCFNGQTFSVSLDDKLNLVILGFLYALRNNIMHGSTISLALSSKTSRSAYATDYYAFLLTYYFTLILILDRFSADYPADKYAKLAENMDTNVSRYVALFGTHVIGL